MKETLEVTEKAGHVIKVNGLTELQTVLQNDHLEGLSQPCVAQCEEFLQALGCLGFQKPMVTNLELWDDANTFLDSFEQVAKGCRWPRDEWVVRLVPALSGEAERAFVGLGARDREDYEKVKAAILQGEANKMEVLRQHFRQFRYQQVEDPRRIYGQLRELCHQWLKPERHSKEQILELLILEQFLAISPWEIQAKTKLFDAHNVPPKLVERLRRNTQETKAWEWQVPSNELPVSPSDTIETHQGQIYEEVNEKFNKDLCFLANGITAPNYPNSGFPPEKQDMAEASLTEGRLPLSDVPVSFDNTKWSELNPTQGTIHWEVTEETLENTSSLEGFVIPKPEATSQMEQGEMVIVWDPEMCKTFTESIIDDSEPQKIKEENYPQTHKEPKDRHCLPLEISQGEPSLLSKIYEEKCKFEGQTEGKPTERWKESMGIAGNHVAMTALPRQTQINKFVHHKAGRWPCSKARLAANQIILSRTAPYKCPVCEKCFQRKRYLTKHKRLHERPKEYQCSECRKSFGQREEFIWHQKIHTGKKPHECPQCGKCFSQRESQIRHERIHTGKKPYRCRECVMSFCRRDSLARHQKTHKREKPFACTVCGMSFSKKEVLLQHRVIHMGEKPYKCRQCGESFTQRGILNRHEKIHRGGKTLLSL